ncbi:MAG TPA: LpqB family beta-propeller domain-containing protein [Rhizomicrobium sp.]|jgi:TolB protein|nr:LpqB family beta-propeller domain-containing protein [Rhizomicrobium sp.]
MTSRIPYAALALFAFAPSSGDAAAPLSIPYQVTYSQNLDISPSPDGKRRVIITLVAGVEQFFVTDSDGGHPIQVTQGPDDHEDPAWSPDGKSIAYVLIAGDTKRIYTMNPDGNGATPLSPEGHRAIHPSWSSDSRRVIYCTDDDLAPPRKNDSDILATDVATKATTTIVTGGINTYPAWSPDMKHLAFRRMLGETNSEVFLADGDGANPRNLSNNPAFDGWPAWSPDGKRIAFGSNRRSNYQIFVMDADGTNVQLVANTNGRATAPRWAPDGKTIYFTVCINVDYGTACEIMAAKL